MPKNKKKPTVDPHIQTSYRKGWFDGYQGRAPQPSTARNTEAYDKGHEEGTAEWRFVEQVSGP